MTTLAVFRCPQCKEFINDSMTECRYCGSVIDRSKIDAAIEEKKREQRTNMRRVYATHIWAGLCVLLIFATAAAALYGLALHMGFGFLDFFHPGRGMVGGYVHGAIFGATYAVVCLSLGGLGDFLYGLIGWLGPECSK